MKFNFLKKLVALRTIFDSEDKISFIKISFLLVISVFLEIIALSFIAPILSLLQGLESKVPILDSFINLNELSLVNLLFYSTSIIIIKNIIQFYSNHYQNTIGFFHQRKLSNKVLNHYLNNSFVKNSQNNSSDVINNIIKVVNTVCQYMILPLFYLISEITLIASIFSYLIYFDFYTSILIGLFFGISLTIYNLIVGKKIALLGKIVMVNDSLKIKYITESIMSFVSIKLGKKQEYFLNKFNKPNEFVSKSLSLQFSLRQLPKYYFEILLYLFLLLLVLVSPEKGDSFLTKLGVFVAAMIKILPSLNRVTGSIQSMKFSESALNQLISFNLYENRVVSKKQILFKEGIYFENVSFSYPEKSNVINNFSFSFQKNKIFGIIGDSGRGKTTLLNLLLGNLFAQSGSVKIDEESLNERTASEWQNKIGYLPQKIFLLDDTIIRNIAFGVEDINIDKKRINEVLKLSQLETLSNTLNIDVDLLGENGNKLSGGQIQRIGLARSLYNNPSVLFFDEFTSALDDKVEKEILHDINKLKQNKTIFIISHKKSIIEFCDEIINLNTDTL